MTSQPQDISELEQKATKDLAAAVDASSLEAWRVAYIGRKGSIPTFLRNVKNLPAPQRREAGAAANVVRVSLEKAYQEKLRDLVPGDVSVSTQDGDNIKNASKGHLHPITITIRRVQNILASLGFTIVEGPELEEEYYDFDALNISPTHPSRAETDSYYIAPRAEVGKGLVLRTSTSAVQVRTAIEQKLVPPFRIASPGRVFRNEKPDATHESMFHQVEALAVGKDITIANYRYVTEQLFSQFFGKEVNIRLRPGYFPFVEPGFEVDMTCVFCQDGCRICKGTKWLEMGGAGMVHPNVLRNMNIDPEEYQGFAFGYGMDRLTLLRHGIPDIRLFWSGEIQFLKQFS